MADATRTGPASTYALRYLSGPRKIEAIKLVRELTGLGLREAKQIVDERLVVTRAVGYEQAEAIVGRFAEFGAQIELIPEFEQRLAFDPEHPARGDQPVERLLWSDREIAWERRIAGVWQRERTQQCASAAEVEGSVAEQIDRWTAQGLELAERAIDVVTRTSAREPQLEQELRTGAHPHEAAAVYSDWLQQRGDPRGDIIALATHADQARLQGSFTQALADHRAHLFGPLEDPSRLVTLEWALGLVRKIALEPARKREAQWPGGDRELLEILLALPICACVRSLRCDSTAALDPELWATLAARDPAQLAGLRELALHGYDPIALARFDWSRVPRLERLELILHAAIRLELADLRELFVQPSGIAALLGTLSQSSLPRLETLSLCIDWLFTDEEWDATDYLGEARPQLAKLVTLPMLAGLRSLRVTTSVEFDEHGEFPTDVDDAIPNALLAALLGAGLADLEIDLRGARLGDQTWAWLREAAPRHPKLLLP